MLFLLTGIAGLLFVAYSVLIVIYWRLWRAIPYFAPYAELAVDEPAVGERAASEPTAFEPVASDIAAGGHSREPATGSPLAVSHASVRSTRITVLIPARNEEAGILACLRSLAGQIYPRDHFEVIVLDDHSTDRTASVVQGYIVAGAGGLALRCLRIADVPLPAGLTAYKKFAIETGVEAALGELIVTTDADCFFHPQWLSTLAACYEEKDARFIAAPVRIGRELTSVRREPLLRSGRGARSVDAGELAAGGFANDHDARRELGSVSNSLLGILQTLDFITLQGITGAAVHSRFHSMCNGANLAYSREAFYEVGGFKDIDHIPSGDDMLLMHKIYLKYPNRVFFLKSRDAIVSTHPETQWKGFLNQRVRWASKADTYDDQRIFWVLLLVYIVNVLFIALAAGAFFNYWWLWLLLVLLVVKTIVEYPFVREVASFFGQQPLMVYFPLLQPLHILYTIIVGWLGKFGSYSWKDRTIKK